MQGCLRAMLQLQQQLMHVERLRDAVIFKKTLACAAQAARASMAAQHVDVTPCPARPNSAGLLMPPPAPDAL